MEKYLEQTQIYYKSILPNVEFKCIHFFVIGEKKDIPSALGTHKCACKLCGENYFQHATDMIVHLRDSGIEVHTHAWDKIRTNVYRCVSGCDEIISV